MGLLRTPAGPQIAALNVAPEAMRTVPSWPSAQCKVTDDYVCRVCNTAAHMAHLWNSLSHLLLPCWPPCRGHRWTAPFGTSVTSSCWHFPTRHRNWARLWQSLSILVNLSGWRSCPSQRWCTGSFDSCLQSQANRSDQSHWQPWTAPLGLMSSDGDWQPSIGGYLLPIVGQVILGYLQTLWPEQVLESPSISYANHDRGDECDPARQLVHTSGPDCTCHVVEIAVSPQHT